MEEANDVVQRLREEVDRLNQELAAIRGQGAAQTPGPEAAAAPGGVPHTSGESSWQSCEQD